MPTASRTDPYAATDSRYVRALANPTRLRVLAALKDHPQTLENLGRSLGLTRRSVAYHVGKLRSLGFVTAERDRHDNERVTYRVAAAPMFTDAAWAELPPHVQEAAMAAGLAQVHAEAVSAAAHGGFERSTVHLSRTPLRLNEARWLHVSQAMTRWMNYLEEIGEPPPGAKHDPVAEPISATAVLMLFESPAGSLPVERHELSVAERGKPESDELLARTYELFEQFETAMVSGDPPWDLMLGIVNQLRILIRAVLVDAPVAADPS